MPVFRAQFAGLTVEVHALFESTRAFCADYLVEDAASVDIVVRVSEGDIDFERKKSADEDIAQGIPIRAFSDEYLETLAVYRQIADAALSHGVLLFHGSCLEVDGRAFLFAAPSGTGKSTHAALWLQELGDRARYLNDDKPLLRFGITESPDGSRSFDGSVVAYGTPWDGKHRRSSKGCAPLAGIFLLSQAPENAVAPAPAGDAFAKLFQQSYRPREAAGLQLSMALAARLVSSVPVWHLECLPNREAALLAMQAGGVSLG